MSSITEPTIDEATMARIEANKRAAQEKRRAILKKKEAEAEAALLRLQPTINDYFSSILPHADNTTNPNARSGANGSSHLNQEVIVIDEDERQPPLRSNQPQRAAAAIHSDDDAPGDVEDYGSKYYNDTIVIDNEPATSSRRSHSQSQPLGSPPVLSPYPARRDVDPLQPVSQSRVHAQFKHHERAAPTADSVRYTGRVDNNKNSRTSPYFSVTSHSHSQSQSHNKSLNSARRDEEIIWDLYNRQRDNSSQSHSQSHSRAGGSSQRLVMSAQRHPPSPSSHASIPGSVVQKYGKSTLPNLVPYDQPRPLHLNTATSAPTTHRTLPNAVFESATYRAEERADRLRARQKKQHPLMQERKSARTVRVGATTGHSAYDSRAPVPRDSHLSKPPRSFDGGSTTNFHHTVNSMYSSVPKPRTLKTQILVDPALEAAQRAREEKASRKQNEREIRQRLSPSLDDFHFTVLQWLPYALDSSVKADLKSKFQSVPLTFDDEEHYQSIFYPLLLEECRSAMIADLDEMTGYQEEAVVTSGSSEINPHGVMELLSIDQYNHVNKFHYVECHRAPFHDHSNHSHNRGHSGDSQGKPLFTTDDLVLLWYRPTVMTNRSIRVNEWKNADLVILARLERIHGNKASDGLRASGVRYKLQVTLENVDDRIRKYLLTKGAEWGVAKVTSLVTVHREYRALASCKNLPLFQWLIDPSSALNDTRISSSTSVLARYDPALIASYNPSQQKAIARGLSATEGITLIQGPPGTGKTKTIVGLINLILLEQKPVHAKDTAKPNETSAIQAYTPAAVAASNASAISRLRYPGKVLVCAPSNAAIDEIVVRLLAPDSLKDNEGKPMKVSIVRVGAGRHRADRDERRADAAKCSYAGVDIESVSLDRLVEERMRQSKSSDDAKTESSSSSDDDADGDGVSVAAANKVPAYYKEKLNQLKADLDFVDAQIVELEDKKSELDRQCDSLLQLGQQVSDQMNANIDETFISLKKARVTKRTLTAEKKRNQTRLTRSYDEASTARQRVFDNRELVRQLIISDANIVATTLSGAGLELLTKMTGLSFDCLIVDEAAQAIELQTLIPLKYESKRVLLVGDDQQLAATVISQSATHYDYQQSLFERLRLNGVDVQLIDIQYRMHPEIRQFPSAAFYQNRLNDADVLLQSNVILRHPALIQPLIGDSEPNALATNKSNFIDSRLAPFVIYDIDGREQRAASSIENHDEAEVAVQLFTLLREACSRREFLSLPSAAEFVLRVGIVTPYRQQVKTLKRAFLSHFNRDPALNGLHSHLEIDTVDSFQGREKDFILFSAVRSHTYSVHHQSIGFVADENRLNVALTRAKYCLFLIGSMSTLSKELVWKSLYQNARQRQCCIRIDSSSCIRAVFGERLHSSRWVKSVNLDVWQPALQGVKSMDIDSVGDDNNDDDEKRELEPHQPSPPPPSKQKRRAETTEVNNNSNDDGVRHSPSQPANVARLLPTPSNGVSNYAHTGGIPRVSNTVPSMEPAVKKIKILPSTTGGTSASPNNYHTNNTSHSAIGAAASKAQAPCLPAVAPITTAQKALYANTSKAVALNFSAAKRAPTGNKPPPAVSKPPSSRSTDVSQQSPKLNVIGRRNSNPTLTQSVSSTARGSVPSTPSPATTAAAAAAAASKRSTAMNLDLKSLMAATVNKPHIPLARQ